MLFALSKLAIIEGSIFPFFFPMAIFKIVDPMSHVLRSVLVVIDSITICTIIKKFSFIDVSIKVIENALAVSFAFTPLALILGSVTPDLLAMTMFNHKMRWLRRGSYLDRGSEKFLDLA